MKGFCFAVRDVTDGGTGFILQDDTKAVFEGIGQPPDR